MPHMCLMESYDYVGGTLMVQRQDEIRIVYSTENIRCLFPDGTKITTEIFTEREQSTFGLPLCHLANIYNVKL